MSAGHKPWPWCNACRSWHHPDNPTCYLRAGRPILPPVQPHEVAPAEDPRGGALLWSAAMALVCLTLAWVVMPTWALLVAVKVISFAVAVMLLVACVTSWVTGGKGL